VFAEDPAVALAVQRSFDDLGTPLADVTFCVIDLETTGADPRACAITEVGAAKFRFGECLGTYQTLVTPGQAIPPAITVLTGITNAMVVPAPTIDEVLPALSEFVGGTIIVGHNIRFDLGFLRAALDRAERPPLANRSIDTVALARRLVADEVPNCRLGTLADRFRLDHRPTHRALDDVLATADLLHVLLERAGRLGVTGLDDLLALPLMGSHPQAAKLSLTQGLPRTPGVYAFRDRQGRVLYVGKATNLRARVRSYFSTDERRKVGQLLRETTRIDHEVSPHALHAAVRELRLIHRHEPRFNRQGTGAAKAVWLKLTLAEPFPRLSVARTRRDDGGLYLGPVPGSRLAQRAAEAVETVVPLRRCSERPGRLPRSSPCTPAQLGVATCPCAGTITPEAYAEVVAVAVRGLTHDPQAILSPLDRRMRALARAERYEEARDVRDRAAALAAVLRRQRRLEQMERSGRVELEVPGGGGAELLGGLLVRSWAAPPRGGTTAPVALPFPVGELDVSTGAGTAERARLAEERILVAGWLDRHAHRVRLLRCDGELSSPCQDLPSFSPPRR
jgi:DNA polymerase III subunit epsilon